MKNLTLVIKHVLFVLIMLFMAMSCKRQDNGDSDANCYKYTISSTGKLWETNGYDNADNSVYFYAGEDELIRVPLTSVYYIAKRDCKE